MDGQLQAVAVGFFQQVIEHLLVIDEDALIFRVALIGLAQRGGLSAQGTVGQQLEGTDLEELAAVAGAAAVAVEVVLQLRVGDEAELLDEAQSKITSMV